MKTIFGIIAIIFGGLSLICLILLVALVKSNKGKEIKIFYNTIQRKEGYIEQAESFIDKITNKRNFRLNLQIISTLWKVNLIVT